MKKTLLKSIMIFALISLSFTVNAQTKPNDREFVKISNTNIMNGGDLCPSTSSSKYHHHFVLIDATSRLRGDQIDWIKRMLFSDEILAQMAPYDKLTIMRLGGIQPSSNRPLFSKCRPRNGNAGSIHNLDQHNSFTETQATLVRVYNELFVGDINKALRMIENEEYEGPITNEGSPILEQIKEISRLADLDFSANSGYETRKLTIVSDLAQNTERLGFYENCPGNKKCPSWKKFKENKQYKIWVRNIEPKFGTNMDVSLLYLNTQFDRQVNKQIIEFWFDYFEDNSIPLDGFEIESTTNELANL